MKKTRNNYESIGVKPPTTKNRDVQYLAPYNAIPNRPPIDENEFLHILAKKGVLVKRDNGMFSGSDISDRFLRIVGFSVLFIKDEFNNLIEYIGLKYKSLF